VISSKFFHPFEDSKIFNSDDQHSSVKVLFERRVAENPDKIALECEEGNYSYSDLNKRVNTVAHSILERIGEGPGGINIWLEDSLLQVVSLLACWKVGKAITANENSEPIEYNRNILSASNPDLIITQASCLEKVKQAAPQHASILIWGEVDFSENQDNPVNDIPPERILQVIYTSGSTGKPKGVLLSQRTSVWQSTTSANHTGHRASDKQVHLSPFSHTNGPGILIGVMLAGSTLSFYPLKRRGIEGLADWIQSKQITRMSMVPTVFRFLLRNTEKKPDLSSIKFLHLGGEQVRPDDVDLYKAHLPDSCILLCNIGSTEGQAFCRFYITKDTEIGETVPLGRPWPGKRLLFWDEDNNEVPYGEPGIIVVESEYLADGYKDLPELTAKAFLDVSGKPGLRRFITGDLGKLDKNGNLIFLGREDQQIKVNGHRVEIGYIESQLLQHPEIHSVSMRTWPDKQRGISLAAYFLPVPGYSPGSKDLRNWLSRRIPYYMVPRSFTQIEELPLTTSHKVDRNRLPFPDSEEENCLFPQNDTEREIHDIWLRLFEYDQISCDDDFFAIGGNSLFATRLVSELQETFRLDLPVNLLFLAPTIAELAKRILEGKTSSNNIVPLSRGRGNPPIFMVHGWAGSIFHFVELARKLGNDQPVFGIQDNAHAGTQPRLTSIEALGSEYAEQISRHYPEGPLYLLGYSLGGMIALETARQLESIGRKVDHLFVIDSTPAGLPRSIRSRMILPYLWSRLRTHTGNIIKGRHKPGIQFLVERWNALMWVTGLKRKYSPTNLLSENDVEVPDGGDYYQIISRGYQAKVTDIPVTLLISNHTRTDLRTGWMYISNNQVSTYTIPGQHLDVLNEENIDDFVGIFRKAVTKVNQRAD